MVDLGGYVIIVCENKDKKIKLYGSPSDKGDLEVGDEILEVNGKSLEDLTHTEVISHIHQCIRSRTICLRVKRRNANKLALDLAQSSHVQDAFVIAVEAQARERLERLSALKRIKPVDITKLSHQLSKEKPDAELNGFLENSPIYVTSYPPGGNSQDASNKQQQPSAKKPLSNGHAITEEQPEEIELKQDLVEAPKQAATTVGGVTTSGDESLVKIASDEVNSSVCGVSGSGGDPSGSSGVRRASSPFSNGRTEVLIGQDAAGDKLKPTFASESKTLVDGVQDCITRPRRRSGSALVEADKTGVVGTETVEDAYNMMVVMASMENGPHREMPVDVPDSFIARSKTPPRYPPPRPATRGAINGTVGSPGKPVPPPREPIPRPPPTAQRNINNNTTAELSKEPTKQQLDSIKKYQEQLRLRKEEEARFAQQELVNRSLRGSKKLQALESRPGVINDAFAPEEIPQEDTLHKIIGYGEVVASLQRLQSALKRSGLSSLEPSLGAVQSLLSGPLFSCAISTHNKVQESWPQSRTCRPYCSSAQVAARDCTEGLQNSGSPEAIELCEILGRFEFEGLLQAHDAIAQELSTQETMPPTAPLDPPRSRAPTPVPEDDSNIKIIKIEKTNEPLGATVRNEGDSVMIGRVVRGGAADKSGLLHEGDEVLEVNGIEMRGKSVNEVCDLLSGMTGTLTFLIVPCVPSYTHVQHRGDTLMHMKANFDYDPEDDLYIPCRELGISFQKGDILHVICQDDPNWWQAYREGEEDQSLAGLIPSKSFQHQRETMKQSTISGDKLSREKSRKGTGTFLCAKKNTKKKKKKSYSDAGYPIYASNTADEYDADEILTYDEVALYYPRANHKRPIVLIGPPNIGRHELRQRLMEDSDRFAAAIPHTSRARKDGEVDGQDYHFITRAQFEADILARKFVEHGEYERAYYGTSLDAIRSVVAAGKICVLNLHPQSLKILRSSDLKPYVVFVAPPSLEKLRQKKIRNGEAYKEEELKDIIEKAREMEDKYGHYFDMIINNNDTDRAYLQLLNEINILEREPQWVPAAWVKSV